MVSSFQLIRSTRLTRRTKDAKGAKNRDLDLMRAGISSAVACYFVTSKALRQRLADDLGVAEQRRGPAQAVCNRGGGIDAEQVIDRGQDVLR